MADWRPIVDQLRAALAKARRELNDKSSQIAELQEELAHLLGVEQARDKAEREKEEWKASHHAVQEALYGYVRECQILQRDLDAHAAKLERAVNAAYLGLVFD